MSPDSARSRCGSTPGRATGQNPPSKIRPSRVGKWRALSLLLVHVLVAVHVAHWLRAGTTLSPLEPSEAGDFSRDGIVRAGLVFFVLTIASTLVLGRWFCGWACHIVALQDACRWLLLRLGLRPRPVRLGVLAWVPLLALLHLFFSPWVARWLAGGGAGVRAVELTTGSFWQTFPNAWIAALTFLVCGFAIVWLLGAKGFCTYGCPYGAIFGVVDQLAPARIRVTPACDGCGHCTAVCSSNVNVSQEVHDYGAVIDPGCMKCMDCVSVCPMDALYYGWGKPAVLTPARRAVERARAFLVPRRVLEVAFVLATFALFEAYDGRTGAYIDRPTARVLAIEVGAALLLGWIFRGKARRAAELSLAEESLLATLFLAALLVFRGHGWVPFLFALGLAAVMAYVAFQGLCLLFHREVALQRTKLKAGGRLRRAGVVFASCQVLFLGGWFWMGRHQLALALEARAEVAEDTAQARKTRRRAVELHEEGQRAAREGRWEEAIHAFRASLQGTPGWLPPRRSLASSLLATGRFRESLAECESALELRGDDARLHELASRACTGLGETARALTYLREAVRLAPEETAWAAALQALERAPPR